MQGVSGSQFQGLLKGACEPRVDRPQGFLPCGEVHRQKRDMGRGHKAWGPGQRSWLPQNKAGSTVDPIKPGCQWHHQYDLSYSQAMFRSSGTEANTLQTTRELQHVSGNKSKWVGGPRMSARTPPPKASSCPWDRGSMRGGQATRQALRGAIMFSPFGFNENSFAHMPQK